MRFSVSATGCRPRPGGGDAASFGQASVDHPLLRAAVGSADGEGWLSTGRLALETHPWLADHAVMGSVLLPGTAFLELALHAGDQLGSPVVEELILEAPLVLSEQSAVQLQVSVGELDEGGRRPIGIYSRLQPPGDELQSERREWTRHASGLLVSDHAAVGERALRERTSALVGGAWPPEGSEAVEIDGMYDRMAGLGLDYGPVFQGLRAAWSRDDEIFAEVVLPAQEHEQAALFGVHPALLDAALQIMGLSPGGGAAGEPHGEGRRLQNGRVPLPFSFGDVQLHASGSSSLRVSLSLSGEYASSLVMADEAGGLVASVGSLVLREVSAEQLGSARGKHRDSLFRIDWTRRAGTPGAFCG